MTRRVYFRVASLDIESMRTSDTDMFKILFAAVFPKNSDFDLRQFQREINDKSAYMLTLTCILY